MRKILMVSLMLAIGWHSSAQEVTSERAPAKASTATPPAVQRAFGDTLYSFELPTALCLGITKLPGDKLVVSSGGASSTVTTDNKWIVTTLNGTLIDTLKFQTGSTNGFGFRDLAFDGQYILASDNTQVRKIDTTTYTIASSVTNASNNPHRGIAYGRGSIWSTNFNTGPLLRFSATTGTTIKNYGSPSVAPYGIALDTLTTPGVAKLWYAEPSDGVAFKLSRVDTATGAVVETIDLTSIVPAAAVSGGLEIIGDHPDYPGKVIALVLAQATPDRVYAVEIGTSTPPASLNPFSLVAPPNAVTLTTLPNDPTPVVISWDSSAFGATYKWVYQVPDSTSPRLLTLPSGSAVNITTTLGALDATLAGLGVAQGDSVKGFWTVWAFKGIGASGPDSLRANTYRAIGFKRGVPALTAFDLISPPTNTTVLTAPNTNTPVNITWSKSGAGAKYRWQFKVGTLSSPPTLNIASNNGGFDTTLTVTVGQLDSILNSLSIAPGDSAAGQWSVYAYSANDSLRATSVRNITFRRQTIITYNPGTTTGTSMAPIYRSTAASTFDYSRYSMLYTPTEIAGLPLNARITDVRFFKTNNGATVANDATVNLYLKNTAVSQFTAAAPWDTVLFEATQVYSSTTQGIAADSGWVSFGNITPFVYTGGNLEVIVDWDCSASPGNPTTNSFSWRYGPYAGNSTNSRTRGANSGTAAPTSLTITLAANNLRLPHLQLIYQNPTSSASPITAQPKPLRFELEQNYPNPFNPSTTVRYALPSAQQVTLKVYDLLGREVQTLVNERQSAGRYAVPFNAARLASGIYFYRVQAGDFVQTRKMLFVK